MRLTRLVVYADIQLDCSIVCAVVSTYSRIGVSIESSWALKDTYFISCIRETTIADADTCLSYVVGIFVSRTAHRNDAVA